MTSSTGPLSDLVVVDLSRALAGPHATMMLGDLGARVIKVETPGRGDDTRGWGPPFVGQPGQRESTYFLSANRNKESIALDLKTAADHALLLELVERADVLVENFKLGTLEKLGLTTERLTELNPGLIVGSVNAFGITGPLKDDPGLDQVIERQDAVAADVAAVDEDVQRVAEVAGTAEDGAGASHVLSSVPGGPSYAIARNQLNDSEFTGPTFSDDGRTLFVNIQTPGITLAITGPWATYLS